MHVIHKALRGARTACCVVAAGSTAAGTSAFRPALRERSTAAGEACGRRQPPRARGMAAHAEAAPRAGAPRRQLAAVAAGSGRQRGGGWRCWGRRWGGLQTPSYGNVSEWVQDRYDGYAGGPVSDPQGPASGASRVVRGGCWSSVSQGCRAAFRSFNAPAARDPLPGLPPHQVCCPWPLIACTLGAFCKPVVSQAAPGAR